MLPHARRSLLPEGQGIHGARVLYVHAHPDDETVVTGASIAQLARGGAEVHLLTMTRGERGEVIPELLRHLEVGQPANNDDGTALGEYRIHELAAACAALGVRNQVFAGRAPAIDPSVGLSNGRDRYLDSGMSWGPDGRARAAADVSSAALTAAPVEEAAAHVAAAIRSLRPAAVVTYDDDGGYGHLDHIRTAQVTLRAVELARTAGAGGDGWNVPLTWAIEGEFSSEDNRVQAVVEAGPAGLAAKRAALEAHETQVTLPADPADLTFRFSNGVPQKISGVETFRLLRGDPDVVPSSSDGAAGSAGLPGSARASRAGRHPLEQASLPVTLTVAVVGGLLAGILGTGVHGNIWRPVQGLTIPWGVVLALALLTSMSVWAGTTTRRIWAAAVPGMVAYVVAFVLAFGRSDSPLIVMTTDSAIGLVGWAWFVGILLSTFVSVLVVGRWWRRRRREHVPAAPKPQFDRP